MSLSIDVVIPAYGGVDLTLRCLRTLEAQTVPHTTILADNASPDDTVARVRHEHPGVRVLELGGNLGFAAACNRGAAAGSADVVVLLNNDVECPPEFLERLTAPLARDAVLGSVAALLVRPDAELIDSVGLTVDPTLAAFPRLQGRPVAEAAAPLPVLAGPSGAAAAYRRSAWQEAGGLDERIFFYMEDMDLALRLRALGWGTTAATGTRAVHLGSATAGHRSAWQRRQGGFARGYLLRRYGVLSSRAAPRALATEALVAVGDAAISRDLAALRGRLAGWRAGARLPRHAPPPDGAVDRSIGFRESLRRRRQVYAGAPPA